MSRPDVLPPDWEIVPRTAPLRNAEPTLTVTKEGTFYISEGLRRKLGKVFKVVRDKHRGGFGLVPCKEEASDTYRVGTSPTFRCDPIVEHMKLEVADKLTAKPMGTVFALVRRVEP